MNEKIHVVYKGSTRVKWWKQTHVPKKHKWGLFVLDSRLTFNTNLSETSQTVSPWTRVRSSNGVTQNYGNYYYGNYYYGNYVGSAPYL